MKRYTMSFASACSHIPTHPERTARKNGTGMNFDVTFQVWPSKAAMLKTIEMQDKRESRQGDWKACAIPPDALREANQITCIKCGTRYAKRTVEPPTPKGMARSFSARYCDTCVEMIPWSAVITEVRS